MSTSLQSLKTYLAAYQPDSGLQDSVAGLEVCSRCRSSLPQGPLHYHCIRRRPPASAICRYWSSTGSTRSDSHWAAEFRRQRTYRLEQSATSTTFARSVAEHLQAGTEDASLLIRPATLSRFETLPLLINLPTYLLIFTILAFSFFCIFIIIYVCTGDDV